MGTRFDARTSHPARGRLVLYVCGGPDDRILFTRIARRWKQFTLLIADSGETGFDLAVSRKPRVVILDSELSDMDGEKLVTALRERDTEPAMPIVVLANDSARREQGEVCLGRSDRMSRQAVERRRNRSHPDDAPRSRLASLDGTVESRAKAKGRTGDQPDSGLGQHAARSRSVRTPRRALFVSLSETFGRAQAVPLLANRRRARCLGRRSPDHVES